jgi:putative transposase
MKNSHLAVRRRDRKVDRFKSAGSVQRFLSVQPVVHNTFYLQRHFISRSTLRTFRARSDGALDSRRNRGVKCILCLRSSTCFL